MDIEKVNKMIQTGNIDFSANIEDVCFAKNKMIPKTSYLEFWDFTGANPLVGKNGTTLTLKGSGVTSGLYGINFQGGIGQGGFVLPSELCGEGKYYELQFGNFSGTFAYPNCPLVFSFGQYENIEQMNKGLYYNTIQGKWMFDGTSTVTSNISEKSPFANSLVRIEVDISRKPHIYVNGESWWNPNSAIDSNRPYFAIGGYPYYYMMQLQSLKIGDMII